MPTRFLSNDDLWREIQTRVAAGKRVRVAVAYFGREGATLLKLKQGDCLVVDMSITAVRLGVTNPHEIKKLITRGVKVFSRGTLHAKFIVADKTLITSSANASNNSKNMLDEAGILTTDAAALRRAANFFDMLCTEPVGNEYLKKCIAEYRPPVFKAAAERTTGTRKKSPRIVEAKLWFLGGLVTLNLSDEAQLSIASIERRAEKKLKEPDRTEVSWIRYRRLPKLLANIRIGDWVIQCTKDGNGRHVSAPAQMLGLDDWESPRGAKYKMLLLESLTDSERISLSNFRPRVASVQPKLNNPNPRTTPIDDNAKADHILRLWTPRGRLGSKTKRS